MDATQGTRGARTVGCITAVIGAVLVAAPGRPAQLLGVDPAELRRIGFTDLALVPGLLAGRPRWPWMVARVGLNLAITGYAQRRATTTDDRRALDATAVALAALSVQDVRIARALQAADA